MFDGRLGRHASRSRSFTADDVAAYARVVGIPLSGPSVPVGLLGALVSLVLVELVGGDVELVHHQLRLHAPAFIGELITALVEIVELRPDEGLVGLRTTCMSPNGALVCDGQTLVAVTPCARA